MIFLKGKAQQQILQQLYEMYQQHFFFISLKLEHTFAVNVTSIQSLTQTLRAISKASSQSSPLRSAVPTVHSTLETSIH